MTSTLFVIASVLLVSAISLIGVLFLLLKITPARWLTFLISFASGTLLGAAFFGLLPEGAALAGAAVWNYLAAGLVVFFLIEFAFHWHHHGEREGPHPVTYLNLLGDGLHNFVDGMAIATTFAINAPLGAVTTIAVIAHEIPQELSDFVILIHGGMSKPKALAWNFVSALTAVIGALAGLYLTTITEVFPSILIPFLAGAFIYIGAADLIPEVHRNPGKKPLRAALTLLIGLGLMWLLSIYVTEPIS